MKFTPILAAAIFAAATTGQAETNKVAPSKAKPGVRLDAIDSARFNKIIQDQKTTTNRLAAIGKEIKELNQHIEMKRRAGAPVADLRARVRDLDTEGKMLQQQMAELDLALFELRKKYGLHEPNLKAAKPKPKQAK
jgi:hypothetical protein